ncbi:MAG: ATP-binding protein [Candidatus Bathyarchaeia archaeon]
MNQREEDIKRYFTDFDGRFKARVAMVRPRYGPSPETTQISTTARYECTVKAEYQRDIMRLVEEGMILAVRNFRATKNDGERYTLAEIASIRPEHFGLRGLSDQSYYPMQFEIIQQSVRDWDSNDRSSMMIQVQAIPINYDLVMTGKGEPEYVKGFSYPIVGEETHILNQDMIHQMYNRRILEEMGLDWKKLKTTDVAREDPRLGVIKMFESEKTKVPIYVNFENLLRYHFGVFSFTGGGKSNLLSNVLRRLIYHTKDTKVVIFDISMEYPFLLMDVFADKSIPSKIVLEDPVKDATQLYDSLVKPREFEKDERPVKAFRSMMELGRVERYVKPRFVIPRYTDILAAIGSMMSESSGKQVYLEALAAISSAVTEYMTKNNRNELDEIDEEFVAFLDPTARGAVERYKVSEKSNVHGWATSRNELLEDIRRGAAEKSRPGLTTEKIHRLLEGPTRLISLSISDPVTIKQLAIDLTRVTLWNRKRKFKVKPWVLFVFDEAQEFVPAPSEARGIERECTDTVETLLRQGRKYGLGGCISTQRIAYLNTNALQQLHTYFVGTLPRQYDRGLVSTTFTIDPSILEKTLEFSPGRWLLSSYIATGMENVPIFITADNAETEINRYLEAL